MMDVPISNMEWFANLLPDGSDLYWAILCTALAVLNVWQYAHAHGLTAKIGHIFEHGHAPEGKAIVPVAPQSTIPPPWKGTP